MQTSRINWLYILRLQGDHYYVGTTRDLSTRFEDHWGGTATPWTKKHTPIEVVSIFRDKTTFDENAKVHELMSIHGIDKVRGGSYSNCELSKQQIENIT